MLHLIDPTTAESVPNGREETERVTVEVIESFEDERAANSVLEANPGLKLVEE